MGGLLGRLRGLLVLGALAALVAAALVTSGLIHVGASSAHLVAGGPGVVAGQDGRGSNPVDVDHRVGAGSWIVTPAGASASLSFPDGSYTVLASSSRLRLVMLEQDWSGTVHLTMALEQGMAWTVVKPGHGTVSFQGTREGSRVVGTSTAYLVVAGRRAAGWTVDAPPVRVDLFQGTLAVHDGGAGAVWQLQAGQAVTFKDQGTDHPPSGIPKEDAESPFMTQNLRDLATASANLHTP